MIRKEKRASFILGLCLLAFVLVVLGCAEAESEGGGLSSRAIQTSTEAKEVAGLINNVCGEVQNKLPSQYQSSYNYTLTNQSYANSKGGSAAVNGTIDRKYSASSGSVTNSIDISITIQFTNWVWVTDSADGFQQVLGTITYDYSSYSSTTPSGYYSSLSKKITGSGIQIDYRFLQKYYLKDTISLDVSDKSNNEYIVTGSLTGSKGSFSF